MKNIGRPPFWGLFFSLNELCNVFSNNEEIYNEEFVVPIKRPFNFTILISQPPCQKFFEFSPPLQRRGIFHNKNDFGKWSVKKIKN
ncbi:hypothetical protein [Chryseobacterium sp.]|uniref:hypothetical protein n=1 Tax=Chryseobacterium sp. TaxID=1871047 RepID=UPI00289B0680|nr:hypothetical protein [Chryseobacterium sp.]